MSVVSSNRWLLEALCSLAGVRHRSLVSGAEPPAVDESTLPSFMLGLVHERARELLSSGRDRHTESLGGLTLVARRLGGVVVCLVLDGSASVAEVERKLNVLAVRHKVHAARAAAPQSLARAKEAFVAAAGPFSDRVFDRDWDAYREAVMVVSDETVIQFARSLFPRLSAPKNHAYAATIERLRGELGVSDSVDPRAPTIPAPPAPRQSSTTLKATTVDADELRAALARKRASA
ncbi:MAG: hypothetical protein U0235_33405 [Polyangiaceae bacterium]